jgi:hypothetical protein
MKKLLVIIFLATITFAVNAQNNYTALFAQADQAFWNNPDNQAFLNKAKSELAEMNNMVTPIVTHTHGILHKVINGSSKRDYYSVGFMAGKIRCYYLPSNSI